MDIDKSLYMKEFLEVRETLGSVLNKPAEHVLFTNLYNAFLPRKIQTKVKDIVEEIEEKTILIKDNKQVKKNMTLFDDAPIQEDVGKLPVQETEHDDLPLDILTETVDEAVDEVVDEAVEAKDTTEGIDEVVEDDVVANEGILDTSENKDSKEEVDIDLMGGGHQLKKIVINPNYVAADK
tara:strand:+ start:188 stop:727 length:540 start_codon:yes stop_codon:yes gene_type:complete